MIPWSCTTEPTEGSFWLKYSKKSHKIFVGECSGVNLRSKSWPWSHVRTHKYLYISQVCEKYQYKYIQSPFVHANRLRKWLPSTGATKTMEPPQSRSVPVLRFPSLQNEPFRNFNRFSRGDAFCNCRFYIWRMRIQIAIVPVVALRAAEIPQLPAPSHTICRFVWNTFCFPVCNTGHLEKNPTISVFGARYSCNCPKVFFWNKPNHKIKITEDVICQ